MDQMWRQYAPVLLVRVFLRYGAYWNVCHGTGIDYEITWSYGLLISAVKETDSVLEDTRKGEERA